MEMTEYLVMGPFGWMNSFAPWAAWLDRPCREARKEQPICTRQEHVFGRDLLLWIMILLILYNYIARQAGAAKITTGQAITVMLIFFSMEKLENSGTAKTQKGGMEASRAAFWLCPCHRFYPTPAAALGGCKRCLVLQWVPVGHSSLRRAVQTTKVTPAHLSLSQPQALLSPAGFQQAGF